METREMYGQQGGHVPGFGYGPRPAPRPLGPPPPIASGFGVSNVPPPPQPPSFSPLFPQQRPLFPQQQQDSLQFQTSSIASAAPQAPMPMPAFWPPHPQITPSLLLPPRPPAPKDEEMLQNIEILSEFVARNGPEFEEMAKSKEGGNPKFSFLFNGPPGSDAALGYQYFQWMKRKWEQDINEKPANVHDQVQSRENLESSSAGQKQAEVIGAVAAASPATSDMDMDDDTMPIPLLTNSAKDSCLEHEFDKQSHRINSEAHTSENVQTLKNSDAEDFHDTYIARKGDVQQLSNVEGPSTGNDCKPSLFPKNETGFNEKWEDTSNDAEESVLTGRLCIHGRQSNSSIPCDDTVGVQGTENVGCLEKRSLCDEDTEDKLCPTLNSRKRYRWSRSRSPEVISFKASSSSPRCDWQRAGSPLRSKISNYDEKGPCMTTFPANARIGKIVEYSDDGSGDSKEIQDIEYDKRKCPDGEMNLLGVEQMSEKTGSQVSPACNDEGEQKAKCDKEKSLEWDIDILLKSYPGYVGRERFHHSLEQNNTSARQPLQRDELRPLPLHREYFERTHLQGLVRNEVQTSHLLKGSEPLFHNGFLRKPYLENPKLASFFGEDQPLKSLSYEDDQLMGVHIEGKPVPSLLGEAIHSWGGLFSKSLLPVHLQSSVSGNTQVNSLLRRDLQVRDLYKEDSEFVRKDLLSRSLSRGDPEIHENHLQHHKWLPELRLQHSVRDMARLRMEGLTAREELLAKEDTHIDSLDREVPSTYLLSPLARYNSLLSRNSSVSLGSSLPISHSDAASSRSSAMLLHASLGDDYYRNRMHSLCKAGSSRGLSQDTSLYARVGSSYETRDKLQSVHPAAMSSAVPYDPFEPTSASKIKADTCHDGEIHVENSKHIVQPHAVEGAADGDVKMVNNGNPRLDRVKEWSPVQQNEAVAAGADGIDVEQTYGNEKGRTTRDSRSMKLFRTALADFVKDILKPAWREGQLSKEAYKIIVKKAVDKVAGTMQGHQVPGTQEKIDHYLESSRAKVIKLVEGYVEKYQKA